MKRYLLIGLLLFICHLGKASVGIDSYIIGERVNLCISLNYAQCPQHTRLLYQARLQVMSDYIQTKIEAGLLEDKKFEILCISIVITRPHLDITQGKNGYYVCMSGFPDLKSLLSFVDYFAKPDWKPFCAEVSPIDDELTLRRKEAFFKENVPTDLKEMAPREVWQLDEMQIFYVADSLQYQLNKKILPIPVNANLPVKLKERYLLFQDRGDIIHVIEDEEIILTYPFGSFNSEDYAIYVYPKWINIKYHPYSEQWLLSYSYDKNRFYNFTKD